MKNSLLIVAVLLISAEFILSQKVGDTYRFKINNLNIPINRIGTIADVNIPPEGSSARFGIGTFLFSSGFMLSGYSDKLILLTDVLQQNWINSSWEDFANESFEYDSNNFLITKLIRLWHNSNWNNGELHSFTYDNSNLSQELVMDWENNSWSNSYKSIFTYQNNILEEEIIQLWYFDSWDNYERSSYVYNNNHKLKQVLTEDWSGSGWVNKMLEIHSYVNSILKETLVQYWFLDQWKKLFRVEYEYDLESKLILLTLYQWNDNDWQPNKRYHYSYNIESLLSVEIKEMWNWGNWLETDKINYTYDFNGKLSEELWEDKVGTNWINSKLYKYSYIILEVENETNPLIKLRLLQNYPNPFNPSTTIQFSIGSRQFVSLRVYDALGKEVATLVNEEKSAGDYSVEFSKGLINLPVRQAGQNLTSGVYFYQLRVGDSSTGSGQVYIETKKMILIK